MLVALITSCAHQIRKKTSNYDKSFCGVFVMGIKKNKIIFVFLKIRSRMEGDEEFVK